MHTLLLVAWLAGSSPLGAPGSLQEANTALKMREIVKRVVSETGEQLIGLGSWISQVNYRDPLKIAAGSDHDLRLLLPRGTSPQVARQKWNAVRQLLVRAIEKEFGSQAPKVLTSTNFYAPAQLMRGVEDQADALARFVELKQVPNLGYKGAVTKATPMQLAEGLYGEGAAVYTQGYERSAGRLFYQRNSKVYEGITDLTHLGEGQARYTIGGAAHTAGEWVHHADDAIKAGDPSSLAKYLARIERDLTKARDLARLPTGTSTSSELKALASRLKGGERLADLRPVAEALLRKARLESALVGRFGRAGFMQRAVLRVAVDGIEAANSLGKALSAAAEKVPPERIVQGLVLAAVTYSGARYAGEGEYHAAYANGAAAALGLAPTVLLLFSQAALDAAREGGYDLVAGRQSAFDLLDGVFSANGEVSETKYTLDQLVSELHTEEQLQAFVLARAHQAADRGFGEVSGRHDLKTAEAIYAKCYPVILGAWRDRREALEFEFLDLFEELERGAVLLTYSPNPAPAPKQGSPTVVTVSMDPVDAKDGERLARMRQILVTLFGSRQGTYANVLTTWSPSGVEANNLNQRRFSLETAGKRQVSLDQTISFGATGLPRQSPFVRQIRRQSMIEVDVTSPAKAAAAPMPTAVGGKIAGQYPPTAHRGLSIDYEVAGLELASVKDAVTEYPTRTVQVRVPHGAVTARGNVKFAGQDEVYGPTAAGLARFKVTFFVEKLRPADVLAKRVAELKAAGLIPKEYEGHSDGVFREWSTSAMSLTPGKSLSFDFSADLSWVGRLPKDMAGAIVVELVVIGGLNGAQRPDVKVVVAGQDRRLEEAAEPVRRAASARRSRGRR